MLADDYAIVLSVLRRQRDELDETIRLIELLAPEQPCFVDLGRAPIMAALLERGGLVR